MKRKIAIGLTGIMLVTALTGCGGYLPNINYKHYVELCEYTGVEADVVDFEVSEEEIDEGIEEEMYEYATNKPVTGRAAQTGDLVNIDYVATIDGEETEDYYSGVDEDIVIGEEYVYPEVEDALIGMDIGDTKTVEVEMTEEYAEEEDIGKTASVEVTLNSISIEEIPECDDDFVKENTEYETLEEYRKAIADRIHEEKELEYKEGTIEQIMKYLIDNSTFNGYPQSLYDKCEEEYNANNEYFAAMTGMELADFEEAIGMTEESKQREIEYNVNYELVIGAIAKAEGFKCTKEEVSDYIDKIYEEYGYESREEMLEDYTEKEIGYQFLWEMVTDFLYENATKKSISEEEYFERMEEEEMMDEEIEDDGNIIEMEGDVLEE